MADRTLEENIKKAVADFDSIETAIEDKGIPVPSGTDTSAYADKIRLIGEPEKQEKTLDVTENGSYTLVPDANKALSSATVNVAVPLKYDEGYSEGYTNGYSEGYEASQDSIILQDKTVTENGKVTADEGFTGLKEVNVAIPIKEEQAKSLTVTENGSYSLLPDENKVLSGVDIEVDVTDNRVTEIETTIDESGVLDSTEGTVEEKVEKIIDKAEDENSWYEHFSNTFCASNPNMGAIFKGYTGTKVPKFDVSKYKTIEGLFLDAKNLESIDFYLNYNGNSIYQLCQRTSKLKYIKGVNTSNTTFVSNAFFESAVEEIEMPFDFSKVTTANNTFLGCSQLRKIRFISETIRISLSFAQSSLLAAESIQSIIDGLATVETQQKLTLHSSVGAKLTDEQLITIATKNWTVG